MANLVQGGDLNLTPNAVIRVVVDVLPDARRFTIDLGKNDQDIALHFNPRFNYLGSRNVIVFNTLYNGSFGQELRERHFPFHKGTRVEIVILFDGNSFTLTLPDGFKYVFPNRLGETAINKIRIHGDIKIRTLAFV